MTRTMLAVLAATFVMTAGPSAMAQQSTSPGVQVAPGVQVGPGGVTVGQQRRNCRMVTTTVETPDGRKITKRERRCGDDIDR